MQYSHKNGLKFTFYAEVINYLRGFYTHNNKAPTHRHCWTQSHESTSQPRKQWATAWPESRPTHVNRHMWVCVARIQGARTRPGSRGIQRNFVFLIVTTLVLARIKEMLHDFQTVPRESERALMKGGRFPAKGYSERWRIRQNKLQPPRGDKRKGQGRDTFRCVFAAPPDSRPCPALHTVQDMTSLSCTPATVQGARVVGE